MDIGEMKRTTLSNTSAEAAFWVCRGDRIENIRDLANCIESLEEHEFEHHVNLAEGKNHFAEWIKSALQNEALAQDLNYAHNQDKTQYVKTIRDHVSWLEHA